jgi:DNA polymerase-3 subunit gamma/tau
LSLYNKYRPKDFDHFVHSKFNVYLKKENLTHHAHLFFGPSGTGKTSAARLCMTNFSDKSDNETIISGTHPDYIEINCAVNNGVDDIRNIITDVIHVMPSQCKYKFVVFDECHMLTNQAMNALLKTIEEPPDHVKFIFCTTEINKVLPAIRSRCQIIPFTKINESDLIKIIETVCDGEKYKYDLENLKLIASFSEGSARAAINYIEQCNSLLNDTNGLSKLLGTASVQDFYKLTSLICEKHRVDALILLDEIIANSIDPSSVMNKYADYIADQIVLRLSQPKQVDFSGKHLMIIADGITNILKDFKILQNIKLISKLHILKIIEVI